MKRYIAAILCLLSVFSLAACGNASSTPEPTEKKDYSEFAGIVADPVTWVEEFEKLPIANANMTTDELRQLACDAFKANMTFQWTPNNSITYTYTLQGRVRDVILPTGIAYSGMCYATGIKGAMTGTLYKVLPYYDKETGTLDVEAMGDNMLGIISSACAYGAQQGWNRVSNSHGLVSMWDYNRFDSNIVPVGPYTYEAYDYNYNFNSDTGSQEIIAKNGGPVMFESYAKMLPADGLYSSSAYHVMMCSIAPVVIRNSDGTINGAESYLHVHEQGAKGTRNDTYNVKQENGIDIRMLGTIDNKYTFYELLESGYIPFTIKEFIGEDPVEPGKAWIGKETEAVETGTALTIQEVSGKSIYTNYVLCNIEVKVKAPDGTVLVSYDSGIPTGISTYTKPLMGVLKEDRLVPYANGKNTLHIYARLSNGELLEAFNTILKVN